MKRIVRKQVFTAAVLLALGATEVVYGTTTALNEGERYTDWDKPLNLINVEGAYQEGYTGKGITIGINDSPFNLTHLHQALTKSGDEGAVHALGGVHIQVVARDLWDDELGNPEVNYTYIDTPIPLEHFDGKIYPSHGMMVAGVAAGKYIAKEIPHGVAYNASILGTSFGVGDVVKDSDGSYAWTSDEERFTSQLREYLTHPDIKIINMSWGDIRDLDTVPWVALQTPSRVFTTKLQEELANNDKLIVVSAGNSGMPALALEHQLSLKGSVGDTHRLSVGALDNGRVNKEIIDGETVYKTTTGNILTFFSNWAKYGEDSFVVAPGWLVSVPSTESATTYKEENGTSFSAPLTTGVAALVQEAYPYLSAKQIGDVILSTANKHIIQVEQGDLYNFSYSGRPWRGLDSDLSQPAPAVFIFTIGFLKSAPATEDEVYADVEMALRKFTGSPNAQWIVDLIKRQQSLSADGKLRPYSVRVFYDVPLEEIIGQGIVDGTKAVHGPGALNARRLEKADLKEQGYTIGGTESRQFLYSVVVTGTPVSERDGRVSEWSNDIREIREGYISPTSSQEDLQARYKYYKQFGTISNETPWTGKWFTTKGDDEFWNYMVDHYTNQFIAYEKVNTDLYIDNYNRVVAERMADNVPVGLYKMGASPLKLTGKNTYTGSTVVAEGDLIITKNRYTGKMGSVSGDAQTEKRGRLVGDGRVGGALINKASVLPGLPEAYMLTEDVGRPQLGTLTVGRYVGRPGSTIEVLVNAHNAADTGKLHVIGEAELTPSVVTLTGAPIIYEYPIITAAHIDGLPIYKEENGRSVADMAFRKLSVYDRPVTSGEISRTVDSDQVVGGLMVSAPGETEVVLKAEKADQLYALGSEEHNRVTAMMAVVDSAATEKNQAIVALKLPLTGSKIEEGFYRLNRQSGQALERSVRGEASLSLAAALTGRTLFSDLLQARQQEIKGETLWGQYVRDRSSYGSYTLGGSTVALGADTAVSSTWRVGAFGAYSTDRLERSGSGHSKYGGIYGLYTRGRHNGEVYSLLGRTSHDITTRLDFPVAYMSRDRIKGSLWEVGAQYRYNLHNQEGVSWGPYGRLKMTKLHQDGYVQAPGLFAKTVDGLSDSYADVEGGMMYSKATGTQSYGGRLGYRRVLTGYAPDVTARFSVLPSYEFHHRARFDRDFLVASVYGTYQISPMWSLNGQIDWYQGRRDSYRSGHVQLVYAW